jgi:hypothetical protein
MSFLADYDDDDDDDDVDEKERGSPKINSKKNINL